MRRHKLGLYIRRIHPGDWASDFPTALRLSTADIFGFHYAIAERGFPHKVLEVGTSKLDLKRRCSYFRKHKKRSHHK